MFKVGDKAFVRGSPFDSTDKILEVTIKNAVIQTPMGYDIELEERHLRYVYKSDVFKTKRDLAKYEIEKIQEKIKDLKNEIKNWETYND